ncbi:MAG: response regulator [Thermoguttaceae bacterium]
MAEKVVLLAEDDPGHEAMFRHAFHHSGVHCRLEVVHDGTEVIDYLFGVGDYKEAGPPDMPDLLLLDLKMPKMDGLQVLQVLRRVRSEDRPRFPPVVVLTSSDLDEDVAGAYRWGAQSYIRKPLDIDGYSDAVRETLRYWLDLNRPAPTEPVRLQHVPDR